MKAEHHDGEEEIYLVLYRLIATHGRKILTHCKGRVSSLSLVVEPKQKTSGG